MHGESSLHILALTGGTYFDISVPLKNAVYNKCYAADSNKEKARVYTAIIVGETKSTQNHEEY